MPSGKRKALTPEFKNRVLALCSIGYPPNIDRDEFWSSIYQMLAIKMAKFSDIGATFPDQEIKNLLKECNDSDFLDFVEYIFKTQINSEYIFVHKISPSEINKLFDECDLPYHLTDSKKKGRKIVEYPKIITKDSEVLHQSAIKPTLELLQGQHWRSSDEEFGKALQHYRKDEFGDCVAMCGSSLESVMKIICRKKRWGKNPDSMDAGKLLDIIVLNSNLDPFYNKLLELTHVIRNTKSTAHGAGNQARTVPPHIAQFTLNMTASTILLLTEETKPFS